jgi:hypothetical protein
MNDVDRLLEGLRFACSPSPYRLIPGAGADPDRWICRCPLHPASAPTMTITEIPDGAADIWCRIGCSPKLIRFVLLGDPDLDRRARAIAHALIWARNYRAERRAAA